MLKIVIFAQVLLFCNCFSNKGQPSTAVNVNAELLNIWKELASMKGQLFTATQERDSLRTKLSAANTEINALKQETSRCRNDIDELRRNQTQVFQDVRLLNDSTTKQSADVAILKNEIGYLAQVQNTIQDALHNTTVLLDASEASSQSKFRSLLLDFKDLNRNVSNIGLKIEDMDAVVSAVNTSLRQLKNSEGIIKNNTASISVLKDNMTRFIKEVSGVQQLENSLVRSLATMNKTIKEKVELSKSSLSKAAQQLFGE